MRDSYFIARSEATEQIGLKIRFELIALTDLELAAELSTIRSLALEVLSDQLSVEKVAFRWLHFRMELAEIRTDKSFELWIPITYFASSFGNTILRRIQERFGDRVYSILEGLLKRVYLRLKRNPRALPALPGVSKRTYSLVKFRKEIVTERTPSGGEIRKEIWEEVRVEDKFDFESQ